MKNSNQKKRDKVVYIEKARKKKEEKGSIIVLLKDSRKVVHAIQNKTCLLCQTRKLCVNKTGLCSGCYHNLIPREKSVAEQEAKHKIIEVKITDDRWEN
ncbi:MAG: hypothetical protein KAS98_12265 [Deltaproteobacteria bacterium]|jgi:hypothetical protein|nr:hypothetical protein [Deltaproteobacteria bacterium]MCK5188301.1 hypothetical protein [Deltaproteobacteria bacterium]MCK5422652.1 hypothetical protein [Deltaproteobacteria bacterium]MCK5514364.1 hypothetical protein [Deltaproteobacteria bacterium]